MKMTIAEWEAYMREEEGWTFFQTHRQRNHRREDHWLFGEPMGIWRVLHGPSGLPAVTLTDLRTDVVTLQEWRSARRKHRETGPACIQRDAATGVVIQEEWWLHGHRHRDDGPSVVKYDRISGKVLLEVFFEKGKKMLDRSSDHVMNDANLIGTEGIRPPHVPRTRQIADADLG